jgi:preprotein translocase subunit SecD
MTTSGVYGFITGFDGDIAWLEIDDNVQIRIARQAIQRKVDTARARPRCPPTTVPRRSRPRSTTSSCPTTTPRLTAQMRKKLSCPSSGSCSRRTGRLPRRSSPVPSRRSASTCRAAFPSRSSPKDGATFSDESLDLAVEKIRDRVDSLGVAEPEILRQGDTIVVNLPGVKNQRQADQLVQVTGQVYLRPVLQCQP